MNKIRAAPWVAAHAALTAISVDCVALGSRSRVLAIVPLFHANSWGLVFATPMMGACLVLPGARPCPGSACSGLPRIPFGILTLSIMLWARIHCRCASNFLAPHKCAERRCKSAHASLNLLQGMRSCSMDAAELRHGGVGVCVSSKRMQVSMQGPTWTGPPCTTCWSITAATSPRCAWQRSVPF